MRALVFASVLALAACQSNPGPALMPDAPAPKPIIKTVVEQKCSPFREWSSADLAALGVALTPYPEDSIIVRMAIDWRRYYGDAKACKAAQH